MPMHTEVEPGPVPCLLRAALIVVKCPKLKLLRMRTDAYMRNADAGSLLQTWQVLPVQRVCPLCI